jgi:hypothetical protein
MAQQLGSLLCDDAVLVTTLRMSANGAAESCLPGSVD